MSNRRSGRGAAQCVLRWLTVATIAMVSLVGGCRTGPGAVPDSEAHTLDKVIKGIEDGWIADPPAGSNDRLDLDPPPGIPAELVALIDTERDSLAQADWSEFARRVPIPASWPESVRQLLDRGSITEAMAAQPRAEEPEPDAIRWYARARIALHRDERERALEAIRHALSLAPDDAAILALAAELEGAGSPASTLAWNLGRRSLEADLFQPTILYVIGRHELQQRRWTDSLAILRLAYRVAQTKDLPIVQSLAAYFLAMGLEREGYLNLAVSMYRSSLTIAIDATHGTRHLQDYALVARRHPQLWQSVGDLELRLGRPASALLSFQRAGAHHADSTAARIGNAAVSLDRYGLDARRIYALLLLGREKAAWNVALDLVVWSGGSAESLSALDWLGGRASIATGVSSRLIETYRSLGEPREMLESMSAWLPQADAVGLLERTLDAAPDDRELFRLWLRIIVADRRPETGHRRDDRLPYALERMGRWLEARPDRLADYVHDLAGICWGSGPIVAAHHRLPRAARRQAIHQAIKGAAYYFDREYRMAQPLLEAALREVPELTGARSLAAHSASALGDFQSVERLLKPWFEQIEPDQSDGPDEDDLITLSQAMKEMNREEERVILLRRMIAMDGHPMRAIHAANQLATIESHQVEAVEALITLREQYPSKYEVHLHLSNILSRDQSSEEAPQLIRQAVDRMFIDAADDPRTRFLRVYYGEIRPAQMERARRSLRLILADEPESSFIRETLLMVLFTLDRRDEMRQVLEDALEFDPYDSRLRRLAIRTLRALGEEAEALELEGRMLDSTVPGPRRTLERAHLMLHADRNEEALRLLSSIESQAGKAPWQLRFTHAKVVALARGRGVQAALDWLSGPREPFSEDDAHWLATMPGLVLETAGRFDEAGAVFRRLADEEPSNPIATLLLARHLIFYQDDLQPALELLQPLEGHDEHRNISRLLQARAYWRKGDERQAQDVIDKATTIAFGRHAMLQDMLGDLSLRRGDWHRALVHYRRAWWGLSREWGYEWPGDRWLRLQLPLKIEAARQGREYVWPNEPFYRSMPMPGTFAAPLRGGDDAP
ncbi:MAG: hypothetical protein JJU36_11435 [Phycisphaeraceae bacterium]|nr:hypothetical protein [Phycisphaeraceae bacterium]